MAVFSSAVPFVFRNEGGFQANPNDPCNYDANGVLIGTNWGISGRVAREMGYQGRMEDLTKDQALDIYAGQYWSGLDGVESQPVATKLLDARVQFGVGGGTQVAQAALNQFEGVSVSVDGRFGPATLEAINSVDPGEYLQALCDAMAQRYRENVAREPAKAVFLEGWLSRAAKIPGGLLESAVDTITENPGSSSMILLALVGAGLLLARR